MELIYLWVEDYKNIKNQGFNFSPRFNCHYDGETLSIDKNKDFVNIFPENINVTAIVGKNGSGKSSLLKYINNHWEKDFTQKDMIFLYKVKDTFYCIYSLENQPKIKGIENINLIEQNTSFYTNDDNMHVGVNWIVFQEKIGENGLRYFDLHGFPQNYSSIDMKDNYLLGDNHFFLPQYLSTYQKFHSSLEHLNDIFKFDTLQIRLKNRVAKSLDEIFKDNNSSVVKNIITSTKDLQDNFFMNKYDAFNYSQNILSTNTITFKLQLSISFLVGYVEYYLKNSDKPVDKLHTKLDKLYKTVKEKSHTVVALNDILSLINELEGEDTNIIDSIKYLESLNFILDEKSNEYIINMNLEQIKKDSINKLSKVFKIFEDNDFMAKNEKNSLRIIGLDLVNSNTGATFQTISDGEKQFLRLAIEFLQELFYVSLCTRNKSHIFLADEIDNSLHPEWKKKVIYKIVNLFRSCVSSREEINVHLIFSTHSPFLLSDIPKQNIIFLDTYKESDSEVGTGEQKVGNCKVVDGLKEKKQTFGANIHTLLSDAFFMEDGLMGEFAKEKIQDVINFLNNKKSKIQSEEEAWNIIQIIGEPFLKYKLEEKFHEKYSSNKVKNGAKIKRLEQEIERLKNVKPKD